MKNQSNTYDYSEYFLFLQPWKNFPTTVNYVFSSWKYLLNLGTYRELKGVIQD